MCFNQTVSWNCSSPSFSHRSSSDHSVTCFRLPLCRTWADLRHCWRKLQPSLVPWPCAFWWRRAGVKEEKLLTQMSSSKWAGVCRQCFMFWDVNQQLDETRCQEINIEESKILLKRSEVEISSSESTVGKGNKEMSFKSWILPCYS